MFPNYIPEHFGDLLTQRQPVKQTRSGLLSGPPHSAQLVGLDSGNPYLLVVKCSFIYLIIHLPRMTHIHDIQKSSTLHLSHSNVKKT